jgi:TonB family protein
VILLRATFGHDGSPTKIEAVRGKKRLVPGAIATVRRWRYSPGDADSATVLIGVNVGRTTRGWQPPGPVAPDRHREGHTQPRKVRDSRPLIPPDARRRGIEGLVIVSIILDPEGRVASAYVLRPLDGLNEAALEAVFRWQFEAGEDPLPLEMTVVVNFRLD